MARQIGGSPTAIDIGDGLRHPAPGRGLRHRQRLRLRALPDLALGVSPRTAPLRDTASARTPPGLSVEDARPATGAPSGRTVRVGPHQGRRPGPAAGPAPAEERVGADGRPPLPQLPRPSGPPGHPDPQPGPRRARLIPGPCDVHASFEPRHGEAPAGRHVVKKPGHNQPAGGSRASPPGPLNATTRLTCHPGQAAPSTRSLNQADIVWTARHNASLLAFGLAVHLRR